MARVSDPMKHESRSRARVKLPVPTEAQVLRACLDVLAAHGVFCWRNNTGAVTGDYNGKRRFIRFGIPGASDILGALPDGRIIAVEIKRPGNRPTTAQIAFLQTVQARRGVALWTDDAGKLDTILRWLLAGNQVVLGADGEILQQSP